MENTIFSLMDVLDLIQLIGIPAEFIRSDVKYNNRSPVEYPGFIRAFGVDPDGDIYLNGVGWDSCGRKASPIVYDNVTYYVNTDGVVYYYNSFVVSNSCGRYRNQLKIPDFALRGPMAATMHMMWVMMVSSTATSM